MKQRKNTLLSLIIAICLLLGADVFGGQAYAESFSSEGLSATQIQTQETTEKLSNPERGFYNILSISCTDEALGDGASLRNTAMRIQASGIMLIEFQINLKAFVGNGKPDSDPDATVDRAISAQGLAQIRQAFSILRESGLKAVTRVVYDSDGVANPEPAFPMLMQHIEQLSPIFHENEDVIYVVEAGFIGMYGEWHSTKYPEADYRIQVVNALLDAVPQSRAVNLRTPNFYRMCVGQGPIDESIGFNGSDAARVGQHNDAFLASETDMGTYPSGKREQELAWLNSHTKYTPFGGEACAVSTYNDLNNAIREIKLTHCQYLNETYNVAVKDKWKATVYQGENEAYQGQTGYKYIEDHLGYRFVLREASMETQPVQGSAWNLRIAVENTGFGNLCNDREADLILEKDGKYYQAQIDTDPRKWWSGETQIMELTFSLPSDIEPGEWNAYLKLPDASPSLTEDTRYAIRFANADVWDGDLGANYLGSIQVGQSQSSGINTFGQVNSLNPVRVHEGPLKQVEHQMVIDGAITGTHEWFPENVLYEDVQNHAKLYVKNDAKNLYVYIEDDRLASAANFQFKFSNADYNGPMSSNRYHFLLENFSGLHLAKGTGWDWLKIAGTAQGVMIAKTAQACEYAIPLEYLQSIQNGTGLYNFTFVMLDSAWQTIGTFTTQEVSPRLEYAVSLPQPEFVITMRLGSAYTVRNKIKEPTTVVNGKPATVRLMNHTTLVPIRYIGETTGLQVDYDEETQNTKVTHPITGEYLSVRLNENTMTKFDTQGKPLFTTQLPESPVILENSTYVPVRAITECLGYQVEYMECGGQSFVVLSNSQPRLDAEKIQRFCAQAQVMGI